MNTISLEDILKDARSNGPYQKSLRFTVVASGNARIYTNEKGEEKECINISGADQTRATKMVIYEPKLFNKFTVGKTVIVRNVIVKPDCIVITSHSKVFPTQEMAIPEAIRNSGVQIIHPPPPAVKPLEEALKSPSKTRVSVVGKIVQEDAVQEVTVRNSKVKVKAIYLMDTSAKAKVSLWREITDVSFRAGDYVKITNVVVNTFRNETSLSTTSVSTVEATDVPEEQQIVRIVGLSVDDGDVCFLTQEDTEVTVPVEMVQLAFPGAVDLENYLLSLCSPTFSVKMLYRGGEVVSMELQ